jgi:hypothetical protein
MTWQVEVNGDPWDLDYLVRVSQGGPRRVLADPRGMGFLYESDTLSALTTSGEVETAARDELGVLSGILKLEHDSREPLRQGAIFRVAHDGGRDAFVRVRGHGIRVHFGTPASLRTDTSGEVLPVEPVQSRAAVVLQIATTDAAVSKVLRLLSDTDAVSWVGLYRIHEVIEADVGGQRSIQKIGWTSPEDLKRFKHSANSVQVGGDEARHGKEQ